MAKRFFKQLGILLGLTVAVTGRAETDQKPDQRVMDAMTFLGHVNRVDAVEPAGSHGSMGLGIGAGAVTYAPPENNPVLAAQLGDRVDGRESYTVPRLWLTKGLSLPVDLGITAGRDNTAGFTQMGGYLQWTLYEALAMPAIALRGSYGRLMGLSGTELSTVGGEAVASFGFFKFFTVYGSIGAFHHEAKMDGSVNEDLSYALQSIDQPTANEAAWTERASAAGLKVMIIPPFVSITGEADLSSSTARQYAVKLGFGT